ncbi:MAG: FkbM family methyltransferase [Candidatus Thiothrix putei]|uniref:FkbM family methyltransferase n=1 Tax=Candidatus Thiothrix putei TaxID=3080811 RepID=A0AA95HK93_9GAMM|nr:MAG: FkbM family methyltransferase [Candidatus Thiothrix putei]
MIQIGANDGKYEYSKESGKDFIFDFLLTNPYWQAVLVEPIPSVFTELKKNYSQHKNQIAFVNNAITERTETRELEISGKEGKNSSFFKRPQSLIGKIRSILKHNNKIKINVNCISYNELCSIQNLKEVDFIKIDAEGYDEIIIESILHTDQSNLIPKVFFWEKNTHTNNTCEEKLSNLGYHIFLSGLNKSGNYMDRVAIHSSIL